MIYMIRGDSVVQRNEIYISSGSESEDEGRKRKGFRDPDYCGDTQKLLRLSRRDPGAVICISRYSCQQ